MVLALGFNGSGGFCWFLAVSSGFWWGSGGVLVVSGVFWMGSWGSGGLWCVLVGSGLVPAISGGFWSVLAGSGGLSYLVWEMFKRIDIDASRDVIILSYVMSVNTESNDEYCSIESN